MKGIGSEKTKQRRRKSLSDSARSSRKRESVVQKAGAESDLVPPECLCPAGACSSQGTVSVAGEEKGLGTEKPLSPGSDLHPTQVASGITNKLHSTEEAGDTNREQTFLEAEEIKSKGDGEGEAHLHIDVLQGDSEMPGCSQAKKRLTSETLRGTWHMKVLLAVW